VSGRNPVRPDRSSGMFGWLGFFIQSRGMLGTESGGEIHESAGETEAIGSSRTLSRMSLSKSTFSAEQNVFQVRIGGPDSPL